MGRPYNEEFLRGLDKLDGEGQHSLGTQLAKLSVQGNLPSIYVAKILGVSRMSLYCWFRDKTKVQAKHVAKIEALISLLKRDLADGHLPLRSVKEAKAYAENMIGG